MATNMDVLYDVIVVGAGVEGSYTAYHLAKQGKKTLLLEQFPLPHTRGSSHGQSRIIRKAYTQPHYSTMMLEAYPLWRHLEAETNTKFFKTTGLLMISEEGGQSLRVTGEALRKVNCDHEYLTPSQLKTRYDMIKFGPKTGAYLDHEAGILHADRCLAKIQEAYQTYGGTLEDGQKVTKIHPGSIVTVETNNTKYKSKSVVITAGPWAGQMTRALDLDLPLQPHAVTVTYWKQTVDPSTYAIGSLPAFIVVSPTSHIYGIPAIEYVNHVKSTPDENFILDKHPKWNNIVIGAGFSGHGFKLAPVVGKVLAEMALGQKPSYNLHPYRMNRFSQKAKL